MARLPPTDLCERVSAQTQYFTIAGRFQLESGCVLTDVTIAYRIWGSRNNIPGRTVLVCHPLTGSADVDRWWPGIVARDGAFDPRRDFVVCSNVLGSCYGSTGPVSRRPGGAGRFRHRFPRITVRDMVRAQRHLIDHLGIDVLDLVTGPSLGGMQALEWAVSYPARVRSVAPVGAAGRHSAWCIGLHEAQRAAIYADANWNGGDYSDDSPPDRGLAAARMMAACASGSRDGFEHRFARAQNDNSDYQIQAQLRRRGRRLAGRFDANAYVRLTQAMNDHDVSFGRGDYETVLRSIRQRALVIAVRSDALCPPAEQRFVADCLSNGAYAVIDSAAGHDGVHTETAELARLLRDFGEPRADGTDRSVGAPARRDGSRHDVCRYRTVSASPR